MERAGVLSSVELVASTDARGTSFSNGCATADGAGSAAMMTECSAILDVVGKDCAVDGMSTLVTEASAIGAGESNASCRGARVGSADDISSMPANAGVNNTRSVETGIDLVGSINMPLAANGMAYESSGVFSMCGNSVVPLIVNDGCASRLGERRPISWTPDAGVTGVIAIKPMLLFPCIGSFISANRTITRKSWLPIRGAF